MGDRTPEVKSSGKLTSKYLTPCRTFGLKRRKTPKSDVLKKVRSENDSSRLETKCFDDSPSSRKVIPRTFLGPLNSHNNEADTQLTPTKSFSNSSPLLKITKEKCHLTSTTNKTPKTVPLNSPQLRKEQIISQKTPDNSGGFQLEDMNTPEAHLAAQIKRINKKVYRIEKLKQEEIYMKKHNLLQLQKSTDKWLSTFKEIALVLNMELQARGRTCTILNILEEHNIPPERVGFNEDSLEFD